MGGEGILRNLFRLLTSFLRGRNWGVESEKALALLRRDVCRAGLDRTVWAEGGRRRR